MQLEKLTRFHDTSMNHTVECALLAQVSQPVLTILEKNVQYIIKVVDECCEKTYSSSTGHGSQQAWNGGSVCLVRG
jgi:uncharacterized protein (UPF0264 family)